MKILPLAERTNDLEASHWLPLDAGGESFQHPDLGDMGRRVVEAAKAGSARILMMGAHLLRAGVSRHLIDLIRRGFVDHVAMNGAGVKPELECFDMCQEGWTHFLASLVDYVDRGTGSPNLPADVKRFAAWRAEHAAN